MRILLVTLALASAACASASLKRSEQQAVTRADALVLEGCYTCLTEARGLYEGAIARRRPPALVQRLFEVELLIGLREKELALDPSPAFTRARALAPGLPPALGADRYIELAEAVQPDEIGTPHEERSASVSERQKWAERLGQELTWLQTGFVSAPARQYLSMALDCSYKATTPYRGPPAGAPPLPEPPPGSPPLLKYRAALCAPINRDALERLRGETPRFVEASYFLGRVALNAIQEDGGRKARALMREAYAAFPLSPAITYLSGSLSQTAGDCRAAVRFYDETLARKPLHEDAMLGRAACESFLHEPAAAIASATTLIDRRAYNQGDALYWRAWNHHQAGNLDTARTDIDRAKTLRYNSSVLTLAGMIEHDQNDLQPARSDLISARDLDGSNCIARWYLALVALKREDWTQTGTHFVEAMECYRASALDIERRMRVMAAREDLDPEWRTSQLAGFEIAIKEDRSQESASAYNAAVNFLRGGDRAAANAYADLAARDPVRAPKVEELRKLYLAPAAPR
jgi:tetratricopeptide (TPR) repeat protein